MNNLLSARKNILNIYYYYLLSLLWVTMLQQTAIRVLCLFLVISGSVKKKGGGQETRLLKILFNAITLLLLVSVDLMKIRESGPIESLVLLDNKYPLLTRLMIQFFFQVACAGKIFLKV